MSLLYDRVLNVVNKPPDQRMDGEVDQILPWFRKKSKLFQSLHTDIVRDIVKNCKFMPCKRDFVIIRQGEKGDCFFVILSGTVSIHINTTMTEDDFESIKEMQMAEEAAVEKDHESERKLDKSKYGIDVGRRESGESFGELALINADCVRNATIISEEPTDLLSVDRDLYNRSLRAFQLNEFEERKEFVRSFPLFHNWLPRYKKMMAMSLRKVTKNFQDTIVKQGASIDGIHFILGGQVKIRVDPSQHPTQYPHLFPLGDIAELEREKARELLRKEMNLEQSRRTDKRSMYQRRTVPQVDVKKMNLKPLELCIVGAIDTIGDLEMTMGLSTYSQTLECTEASTFYHLDQRNYDRLIEKRNPTALEMLKDIVHTKLTLHFSRLNESSIPLYRFFLYTLDEKEKDSRRPSKTSRSKTPQEMEANVGNLQKGPLVNMYGPGSVFWLIRKRAKQMKVRKQRKVNATTAGMRLGVTPHATAFGFSSPSNKGSASSPGNVLGGPGQDPATASYVNLYGYQHGPTISEDGEYMDEPSRVYYGDEEEEEYEDEIDDDEDATDYASSDTALCELEERLVQWHNSLGTVQKGKCVVRLHRYQFEDENRPKPGNKVYVRARSKPKNVSFFAFQNDDDDDDSSDEYIKTSIPVTKSSMRLLDNVSDRPSDVMSECQALERPKTTANESDRPQTSLGIPRHRSESKGTIITKKKKRTKQYTAAEYAVLKAELRRRQKQWISLLPRRSNSSL